MRALCSVMIGVRLLTPHLVAQVGSASLTGKVKDITGAGVPGTQVYLQSGSKPGRQFGTNSDTAGQFVFTGVAADTYALKLNRPGFHLLTVKEIRILEGEQKALPTLQLDVSSMADCGGGAALDYIRMLPSGSLLGNVGGSVRLDQGPMKGNGPPISSADVTVRFCSKGCTAKTDVNGDFSFGDLSPGDHSVEVTHPGFYPLYMPGYLVKQGIESIYYSVYLERCPKGNCDPKLRPRKPPAHCE
jgi:hypothetical protein